MGDKKKNTSPELIYNFRTDDIEMSFPNKIIIGKGGKVKHKLFDDVAIDLESGEAQLITPIFNKKKKE